MLNSFISKTTLKWPNKHDSRVQITESMPNMRRSSLSRAQLLIHVCLHVCVCLCLFLRLNTYIYVDIFVFLNKYVHTNAKLSVSRFRYLHIQQKKTRQARLKRASQSITTLYTDSFLIASLSIHMY